MHILLLPIEILLDVMDWMTTSAILRVVCRQLHACWHSGHIAIMEDTHGVALARSPSLSVNMVRWLRYTGERFQWTPTLLCSPRTLVLQINSWMERWNLCRVLQSYKASVERLILRSTAHVHASTLSAMCTHIGSMEQLRSLELRVCHGHFGDACARDMASAIAEMSQLFYLSLDVPMNSITITGLQHIISGMIQGGSQHLRRLCLNISGNWIRGTDYGKELARLSQLKGLLSLQLTFGGWGVRKQFGLEHLAMLGNLPSLQELSITIVGARITCEFFKKAMLGVTSLPELKRLHLDLSASDVGEQCHRGLSVVRVCKRLQRLTVALSQPTERLLSALGAIQFAPTLDHLLLVLDHRSHVFTEKHACEIARYNHPGGSIRVHLHRAKIPNMDAVIECLVQGFTCMESTEVRFLDCIVSVPSRGMESWNGWKLSHLKEGLWILVKHSTNGSCSLAVPSGSPRIPGHV